MLWKIEDQSLSQLFWISTNPNEYKTIAPKEMIQVAVIAEVDVKNASHKPTFEDEHKGELKIKVPKKIMNNPVTMVNWGTDNFL